MAESKRGSSSETGSSPTREIAQALQGIDFPADREKIVEYAKHNNLSGGNLDQLVKLPDDEFRNMADVFKSIGKER